MVDVLHYDEPATRRLLALYETPDVAAQRQAFFDALAPRRRDRVIDVGSGPGLLSAIIADAVGIEGLVCGVDVSAPLLAAARQQAIGRPQLRFVEGDAVRLPLPDESFDAATCVQVLEYLRDIDAALIEMRRVLRPRARVVIVDTDWDSIVWAAPDAARHERVLSAWTAHATDVHVPRTLARRLARAGFEVREVRVLPLFNPVHRKDCYSHRVIELIAGFVAGAGGALAEDARRWVEDLGTQAASGDWFFSLNRYVFTARKC